LFDKKEVLKNCLFRMLLLCLFVSPAWAYSGGTGDVNSPYQIATILDFQQLMHTALDWNKNFIMTADVNLMYVPLTPIGQSAPSPFTYFTGVFDGNNHIIRRARMSRTYDYAGLFGYVGNGGKIRNLGIEDINIAGYNYTGGLVGYAGPGSSIINCHATGAVHNTSTSNFQYLGILVGYADEGSSISNCYSSGKVSGWQYIGGLVGYICYDVNVTNCHSAAMVSGASNSQYLGGLVGGTYNGGNIANCYSTGTVSGNSYYIGGLVGDNRGGSITTSYSTGTVNGSSNSQYVGGLVGCNEYGDISNCYSTGAVSGYQYVGGLAGYNNSDYCSISDCCSASTVIGSSTSKYVGGLVGRNDGTISGHCSSAGNVSGQQYVGGLVGRSDGTISANCYSTGNVSGQQYVGGLVGYYINNSHSNITLTNCYSTGDVNSSSGSYVGGLMGYYNSGGFSVSLNNCYSTGNVTGDAGQYLGGLVGYYSGGGGSITGTITNCYTTGRVTGTSGYYYIGGLVGCQFGGSITNSCSTGDVLGASGAQYVGGLVGGNNYYSALNNCYSTGTVTGAFLSNYIGGVIGYSSGGLGGCYSTGAVSGTEWVGGLVGYNGGYYGSITNCYSTGAVSGTEWVGGLMGENDSSSVTNCYSAGAVSGNFNVGGLIGYSNSGTANNSFWDVNTSGQSASAGGTGKTTTEMKTLSTFISAGWNFFTVWDINDGRTYPFFFKKTNYSGGIGTSSAPYQIACLNDLRNLAADVADYNKCFILTADIDMAAWSCPTAIIAPDTDLMNLGYQGTSFKGTFDGNSHKITHLTINGGSNDYIGLFGCLGGGGQILNLGVEDVNVTANSRVGGLVGFIGASGGTIRNCYTTGVVTGDTYFGEAADAGDTYAGGLAGRSYGNIIECYSTCTVNGTNNFIGGLVGYQSYGNYEAVITSCYAVGAVDGNDYVGGLVGQCDYGIIEASYSVGSVNGNTNIGGLVGYSYDQNDVNTSFWDVNSSSQSASSGGQGKTTAEMKTESTFTSAGWDFSYADGNDAIWYMAVDGYPILTWQISPADIYTDGKNNFRDFAALARFWMRNDCRRYNSYCDWADLNFDGSVDIYDLKEFLNYWLELGIYE
jgi:hypothetical protein